jgi:hypothetical protein
MQELRDVFERRRTKRREVEAEGTLGTSSELTLVNVGPRGFEAETAERLMVGADYDLRVSWEGERIDLHGTVKWSRLDRTVLSRSGELRPVYRSGLEASSTSIPRLERMLGGGESSAR